MTPDQLKDYNRRSGDSTAPTQPVQPLPKPSEVLAVFATTPARKEALLKADQKNEDWRKALSRSLP